MNEQVIYTAENGQFQVTGKDGKFYPEYRHAWKGWHRFYERPSYEDKSYQTAEGAIAFVEGHEEAYEEYIAIGGVMAGL